MCFKLSFASDRAPTLFTLARGQSDVSERKNEEVWRVSTGTDRKGGRRKRCGG